MHGVDVAAGSVGGTAWSAGKVGEAFSRQIEPICPQCLGYKTKADLAHGQARYWEVMHQRAVEREAQAQEKIKELEAKVCLRERQLFGRKSERGSGKQDGKGSRQGEGQAPPPKRRRGQQRGESGHGRGSHGHLPAVEELCELAPEEQCCADCGLPFEPFEGTEDSEVIEIEVRAHRRVIRRKRYRPTCQCPVHAGIVTAAGPPKLIPKGGYGISVWVSILITKYLFQCPTYRLLADLRWTHDLRISQGTVTDGLKRLAVLFEPVMESIVAKNLSEHHWHADETRWMVYCQWEGKVGYRWQLWVFKSKSAVVFKLDPSRSAQVAQDHFGESATGILSVDRYSAYKVLLKSGRFVLAFCWAHVRRDFLGVAKDWVEQHEEWAFAWVERIGELYLLNDRRLAVVESKEAFGEADAELRRAVARMAEVRTAELSEATLPKARRKVLESLKNHWQGLLVFVDHPEVPMDNNQAERAHRGPVVGRKNYYGSGSYWSGQLAATMFSVFQTLQLWQINPRLWLTWYFEACAANGGKAPGNAGDFLPWNLNDHRLRELQLGAQLIDNSS